MPSSSTRSTYQERRIHDLCIRTHYYLCAANHHPLTTLLLPKFAAVLDTDPQCLLRSVLLLQRRASVTERLHEDVGRLSDSGKIWHAGAFLAEVGFLLGQYARREEAQQWCRWGDELQRLAEAEEKREQARERMWEEAVEDGEEEEKSSLMEVEGCEWMRGGR